MPAKYCYECKCDREYRTETVKGPSGKDMLYVCNTCDTVVSGPEAWIRQGFKAVFKAITGKEWKL